MVLEKPIGHDLASARAVNDAVGRVFDESQIFRIDHYLGKESVQNLLVTRFANTFLEPLWNSRWVDHVQITVAESLGVGDRGGYYDHAGALRDMVQNHLLQLLCLVAMEPPTLRRPRDRARREAQGAPGAQADDARGRRPRHRPRPLRRRARRRRAPCASYAEDLGHAGSRTETFVALRDRGAELALGRRAVLPAHRQADGPPRLGDRRGLQGAAARDVPAQRGRHRAQPAAHPGPARRGHAPAPDRQGARPRRHPAAAGLARPELRHRLRRSASPDAYERLLMDVIKGNPTLFMRRDEVEAAWTWVEPILTALGDLARPPEALPGRHHRTRPPPPRSSSATAEPGRSPTNEPLTSTPSSRDVTARIVERSAAGRAAYLGPHPTPPADTGPARGQLACANLAHGFAASDAPAKQALRGRTKPNLAIVSAYNDMLSAHQPFETYPAALKKAVIRAGGIAQFAGGVPAMCDGITQGRDGMQLSLYSRDVIAMSTAIALSHDMFDGALMLGVCDKIVPGLLIGALSFGHLPDRLRARPGRWPPGCRTARRRGSASCTPRARSAATSCSRPRRRRTTRPAPARSTAPRTPTSC